MINQLKVYIKNRESENVTSLVTSNPDVLDQTDENGVSGFLNLAYSGMNEAFDKAIASKQSFTFHEAIVGGKTEQVKMQIVTDKSLVNQYSPDGFTPIALAAFFDQQEIAIALLEGGADPSVHANNPVKVNALHAAVAKGNYTLCKLFLEYGTPVNAPQTQNVTPLHAAAHRGNLKLVKLLAEHGADPKMAMDNGDTPIDIARRDNHHEVVNFLEKV
jgi:uncharacterized protein